MQADRGPWRQRLDFVDDPDDFIFTGRSIPLIVKRQKIKNACNTEFPLYTGGFKKVLAELVCSIPPFFPKGKEINPVSDHALSCNGIPILFMSACNCNKVGLFENFLYYLGAMAHAYEPVYPLHCIVKVLM